MNPFEMVVAIIVVVTIGSVLKARYGVRKDQWGNEVHVPTGADTAENARLRDEIRTLRDRIQVLERVVTDNESGARIDREIEALRDKNKV
ncbi:hypothetical protein [Sphingomonas sp.]|uniref:hypothetical protein n=1 Tax=Sphingomonas sp. TaxID=28214 RepID=UPI001B03F0B3|nr:hypothetical protein [Sphingomonas sp.]MBO9712939.1 hypothetical protein [Sphingomonas sp.]